MMRRPMLVLVAALAIVVCVATAAHAQSDLADRRMHPPRRPGPPDPVAAMVRRMDRYLQRHEVNGVTMDWRYDVSPSEEIRQTVVCQTLAYAELMRLHPRPRLRRDVVEHADFMIGRLADIQSHSPFDGMLADALLSAYEVTREPRFLEVGTGIVQELLAIPTSECVLNGGLMVAMATARYTRLTGDLEAAQKTTDILAQLESYQNPDGSFPHWCVGSRDIHYTGWMAMELIHLWRMTGSPMIPDYLATMTRFLEGRIAPNGSSLYEQPCPGVPGCIEYFYSRATGCWYDYDTRGWTVEPAYCVLLFDHQRSPKFTPVMAFLDSLEDGGTLPDLYGWWPPPDDPEYPWTIADTSVVNMSIVFWALATVLAERAERGQGDVLELDDELPADAPPRTPAWSVALRVGPNPARGECTVAFTLPRASAAEVSVLDPGGRRVRTLSRGWRGPGEHAIAWDGRDERGRVLPGGVYWVRLEGRDGTISKRIVRLR